METKGIVDVHSHFLTIEYLQAVKEAGMVNEAGEPLIDGFVLPKWNVETHLKKMDENGIAKCILSAPELQFLMDKKMQELTRSINDTGHTIKVQHPNRFGVFTALPMPDVDATLKEIAYGLDELGFNGVCLYTNYHGQYLSDEAFAPVMDELNRRKAIAFVHPIAPKVTDDVMLGVTSAMLEFPFDSTRNVMTLIKSGTLERCPDIKFIIAHGGGTLPFLAPRIASLLSMDTKQTPPLDMNKVISQIRSLYFDLTAVTHPGALAAIKTLMPANHLLMGFDYPLMPSMTIPRAIKDFQLTKEFSDDEKLMITSGQGMF